jgi:uncharacterized protein
VVFHFTRDMRRLITEQMLAYVATVCPDNTPNISAQGTLGVFDETRLIFADIKSPQTMINLRSNPSVEIGVVDPFARIGYKFKGRAEVFGPGVTFDRLLRFYHGIWLDAGRKPPTADIRNIALISVERAVQMVAPAYQRGEDELELASEWEKYYRNVLHKRRTVVIER